MVERHGAGIHRELNISSKNYNHVVLAGSPEIGTQVAVRASHWPLVRQVNLWYLRFVVDMT